MKKHLLAVTAIMLVSACQSFKPFTFVHMTDTQIGFIDESPAYSHSDSLMKAAVDAVNAMNPAFVFVTGDLVDNPEDPVQDSVYRTRLAEVKAPAYAVPGNHDYLGGFTGEKREKYIALRGYDRFSFKDRGCAFIGIDSNCIKDGAEEAEAEQWAWLDAELNKARGSKYIFIFLHCPIIRESIDEPEDYFNFPAEKRQKYIGLFRDAGVNAVFSGHTHQEYSTTFDGMLFSTAGPVCNALGHGTPGYNVVNVGKDGIEVEYVPTPGVDPTHCRF